MRKGFLLILVVSQLGSICHAQLLTVKGATLDLLSGATLWIDGDIEFQSGSLVDNEGTIQVSGNMTNDSGSGLFLGNGEVVLFGSVQQLDGINEFEFHDLTLSGTPTIELGNSQTVGGSSSTGVLDLESGVIKLNTFTLSISNGNANAIVRVGGFMESEDPPLTYGSVHWDIGIPQLGVNYIIPFGETVTNEYLPVILNFSQTGSGIGSYTISTYGTDPSSTPNNRPLPTNVPSLLDYSGFENGFNCVDRWWNFEVLGYTVEPTADLTLTYLDSEANGGNNTVMESSLAAQYNNFSVWSQPPVGIADPTNNQVFVPDQSDWNYAWTLVNSTNLLPISLLDFSAVPKFNEVECSWTTVSELNNDFFTVERSADNVHFDGIGIIDGAGTSLITNNYSFIDSDPLLGWSYYRLRDTDFNGESSLSETKAVYFRASHSIGISAYPNPCNEGFYVQFLHASHGTCFFTLRDVHGNMVQQSNADLSKGSAFVDTKSIGSGVYIMEVQINEQIESFKIIVLH
ncbi:MAG: T9SS type A sorting domain-containing protein [Flavobacteriales bacterium]|nr:T9SS type A sorting domain-containing protein [Flavobacteriales bacterium]